MVTRALTQQAIEMLLHDSKKPAVTLYIPMHKDVSPPHMSENQIRFKNLLHQAMKQLEARSDGGQLAKQLQAYLDQAFDQQAFWEKQTESLLVCARPGKVQLFNLPIDTEEYVAVDDCFHLAPVLALLGDNQAFYVLSIAQHNPRLFKGDMYGIHTTSLKLPYSVESGLNIDEANQKSEQSQSASGSSMSASGFNGRGGARDPREEDRLRFFRLVDQLVCNAADRSLPLVLAGIDAETAEYRHLSKYPNITHGTITGSFSDAQSQTLFEPAQAIIRQECIRPRHESILEAYQRLQGTHPERIAQDHLMIAEAAKQGRIDTLITTLSRHTADTVRDNVQAVMRITFPEQMGAMVNKVAGAVVQTSGRIISIDPARIPGNTSMVALLRY